MKLLRLLAIPYLVGTAFIADSIANYIILLFAIAVIMALFIGFFLLFVDGVDRIDQKANVVKKWEDFWT